MNDFPWIRLLIFLFPCVAFADDAVFSFSARATGVDDSTPLEFILITPESGHDYESIAVSRMSAEDILQGLRALEAVPGHPANPHTLQFWPKGEWLDIEISFDRDGETVTVPAGDLVQNTASGTTLGQEDWTFCGSAVMSDKSGKPGLAADVREPGSIMSVYNEPDTLIDRSGRAPKGVVYGSLIVNTNLQLLENQELTVSIRRKSATNTFQALDVSVEARIENDKLSYRVKAPGLPPSDLDGDLDALVACLKEIRTRYPNINLSTAPDSELSLAQVQSLYEHMMALDADHGHRFNAPAPPHFFFQSFFPDPAFRDPAVRPSQPWEMHIERTPEGPNLTLLRYAVKERDPQGEPTLEEERIKVTGPEDLQEQLKLGRYDLPVLLVFAPASLPYGDLIDLLAPVRKSYDTFYFYLEK
jgi:hypothetical protein